LVNLQTCFPPSQEAPARVCAEADNPFPWMSEPMDQKKEKNFFGTRVIEYRNGGTLGRD
jgi:ribonucleoside-diphosphate reductase beta chain